MGKFRGRALTRGLRGSFWVAGLFILMGLSMLGVGLAYLAARYPLWPAALGWILMSAGTFTSLGVLYHHKTLWGSVSVALILVGVVIVIGHYVGWW